MSDVIVISMVVSVVSPDVNISKRRVLHENWQQSICMARTQTFLVNCSYNFYRSQLQIKIIERSRFVGRETIIMWHNCGVRLSGIRI